MTTNTYLARVAEALRTINSWGTYETAYRMEKEFLERVANSLTADEIQMLSETGDPKSDYSK